MMYEQSMKSRPKIIPTFTYNGEFYILKTPFLLSHFLWPCPTFSNLVFLKHKLLDGDFTSFVPFFVKNPTFPTFLSLFLLLDVDDGDS